MDTEPEKTGAGLPPTLPPTDATVFRPPAPGTLAIVFDVGID